MLLCVGGATVANQKISDDETTESVSTITAESDIVAKTHEVVTSAATATTDTTANTAATVAGDRAAVTNGATDTPANGAVTTDTMLTVAEKPKSGVTEKEKQHRSLWTTSSKLMAGTTMSKKTVHIKLILLFLLMPSCFT